MNSPESSRNGPSSTFNRREFLYKSANIGGAVAVIGVLSGTLTYGVWSVIQSDRAQKLRQEKERNDVRTYAQAKVLKVYESCSCNHAQAATMEFTPGHTIEISIPTDKKPQIGETWSLELNESNQPVLGMKK